MKIGFYIREMNYRGISNSIFDFAYHNNKILKNKSYIFFNACAHDNKKEVIKKFKKNFRVFRIKNISEIKEINNYIKLDYIYFQRSGFKEEIIPGIKNIIHAVFPNNIWHYHGYQYAYISQWLSKTCSNNKISFVPLMISMPKNNTNMRNDLNIPNNAIVFGCHGGETSFDLIFVQDAIKKILELNNKIFFIFMNINKFISHKRVIFLKGSFDKINKAKFINTCNAMVHARSLGESFGLSCAEFAIKNKPIFTYAYCRQRAHFDICKKKIIPYFSYNDFIDKILKFKKNKDYNSFNTKKNLSEIHIIKKFRTVFLKKSKKPTFNVNDIVIIILFDILKNYFYIRHKIYIHFYKLISPKI
jgi:hypothetical protein